MGLVLQSLRSGAWCGLRIRNGMSMVKECHADCDYIEATAAHSMLLVLINLRGARSPA
jgi:hypothetical protein